MPQRLLGCCGPRLLCPGPQQLHTLGGLELRRAKRLRAPATAQDGHGASEPRHATRALSLPAVSNGVKARSSLLSQPLARTAFVERGPSPPPLRRMTMIWLHAHTQRSPGFARPHQRPLRCPLWLPFARGASGPPRHGRRESDQLWYTLRHLAFSQVPRAPPSPLLQRPSPAAGRGSARTRPLVARVSSDMRHGLAMVWPWFFHRPFFRASRSASRSLTVHPLAFPLRLWRLCPFQGFFSAFDGCVIPCDSAHWDLGGRPLFCGHASRALRRSLTPQRAST